MDLNLAVICGRLAAPVEVTTTDGETRLRVLLAVYSEMPARRLDLIPAVMPNPPDHLLDGSLYTGQRLWVSGMLQRRFPEDPHGSDRRSQIQLIAHQITTRSSEDDSVCI